MDKKYITFIRAEILTFFTANEHIKFNSSGRRAMKRFVFFSCLILTLSIFMSCGSGDGGTQKWEYYFEGTVYLRGEPATGVTVNMGYRDTGCQIPSEWRTEKQMDTESDGKFKFTLSVANETGFRWRARAMHPETGFWTDWTEGGTVSAGVSGTGTINFNLD